MTGPSAQRLGSVIKTPGFWCKAVVRLTHMPCGIPAHCFILSFGRIFTERLGRMASRGHGIDALCQPSFRLSPSLSALIDGNRHKVRTTFMDMGFRPAGRSAG